MIRSEPSEQILVCVELRALPFSVMMEQISGELGSSISTLCSTLGIPGSIKTEVSQSTDEGDADVFKLWVNGRRVRYPHSLIQRIHGYFVGEVPKYDRTLEPILTWIIHQSTENQNRVARFLAFTCVEAVKQTPSVLFGKNSAERYLGMIAELAPSISKLRPEDLSRCLRAVLDARISIADVQTIAALIDRHKEKSTEALSQEIISARSADSVEIHMPADYLSEVIAGATGPDRGALSWLRDGLFEELGLTFPTFHFVADDNNLLPRSFALKINDLLTTPRIALPGGTVLVNDTLERSSLLKELFETHPIAGTDDVVVPASDQPGAFIASSLSSGAESAGLTTWNPVGYLTLCMADEFRTHAACFVTVRSVKEKLTLLESSWPTTIQALRTEVTDQELTGIFQQLVSEGVSLHDLLSIMDRIIDREYLSTEPTSIAVLGDYPASVPWSSATRYGDAFTSFVRAGLGQRISAKVARGHSPIVTYLLDVEIERMLLASGGMEGLAEKDADRVLQAFRSEMHLLPPTAQTPSILTTAAARPIVRAVIAQEYPKLSVLAYEELSPELAVQPIARISL